MTELSPIPGEERRERQLAALYELWRAVPYTAVDKLLQMLAERATAAMDAHTCSLLLRERGGDTMTVAASVGLAQDVAGSVKLLVGERIAGRVAATGQPVLLNSDPSTHPLLTESAGGDAVETRPEVESALCAPMLAADGGVLGVLCLSRLRPAERFTDGDLRVFSLFAAQAGSVIAQVRVGADRARREQELAALGQVAEAIRAQLPEEALLQNLAEGVQEVIGFERCQVWRRPREGDDWDLVAGRGFARGAHVGGGGGGQALWLPDGLRDIKRARLVAEVAAEQPEAARFFGDLGVKAGVVAPLLVRGACAAIVLADISAGNELFLSEMTATLQRFAGHVSVALENARLFAELEQAGRDAAAMEREMARTAGLAALGQLAATVAHELRNPLCSIKGAAQFLLTECGAEGEDSTVRDFLSIVVEEVNGLSRMTTDLLEFARPSPPRPERCDLVAVARNEVDFLRAELDAQDISIQESYAAPAWIDGDSAQLGRALRNLLLNGAQAMSQGGRLSVSVQPSGDRPDGGVPGYALAVTDSGTGVPEAIRDRLWEPFFTTKAKGTGLGLAQVRQMVEAHGGDISVGDAPGGGALFTIRLPGARA
uniref:histidine kinase n=1 Tax=uncultured Armatimonadetes bacterium TaxID=157466 RepID=A0A6J4IIF3_9BACT|nr:Sporulation kinase E [uncultured Armatimonadetes bacterium]